MRRTAKVLQPLLLVLVFAVLILPCAFHAAPAFVKPEHAIDADELPQAQRVPTTLPTTTAAKGLSNDAPLPNASVLAQQLDASLTGKAKFAGQVIDGTSGKELYAKNPSAPMMPASNVKLLTAVTAVKNLGADHRFSTTVLAGRAPDSIVLKAGGDALLGEGESKPAATNGHAGLRTLADQVADSLRSAGKTSVQLYLDDAMFTGPALSSAWERGDIEAGETAPIYPLAIDSAMAAPGSGQPRPQDAAMAAAKAFARSLSAAGITVNGDPHRAASATAANAQVYGSVQSATVAAQINYTLQASDNYLAEVLARMSALAEHRPGSFEGAIETTKRSLEGMGVDISKLVLADNTGLAVADRVSAEQLTKVVQLIANGKDPDVRRLFDGLPIAGLSGTLQGRFAGAPTKDAAGFIRAKTGSLNTVSTLSGLVVDADGRLLVFSFLANDVTSSADQVHQVIDRSASIVADCGCH